MNEKQIWNILEIEPTDDVEEILAAYRKKLVVTNPEDDQEGFMALKEAYDEAIRLAEGGDEEEAEEELSETMVKVDELYKDITKRVDTSLWDELFAAPEFRSIDEQEAIRNDFLNYTMNCYKYPREVWERIDHAMAIVQDADSLAEGIRIACIGRDILVVDVDSTLDEPVVGRYRTFANLILATNVIAVINNGLRAVNEVTRGLPFVLVSFSISGGIRVVPLGDGLFVQGCQRGILSTT